MPRHAKNFTELRTYTLRLTAPNGNTMLLYKAMYRDDDEAKAKMFEFVRPQSIYEITRGDDVIAQGTAI